MLSEVQRFGGKFGFTKKKKKMLQNCLQFMKHEIYTQREEHTGQYFMRKQAEAGLF